jgi:hypothetical protein
MIRGVRFLVFYVATRNKLGKHTPNKGTRPPLPASGVAHSRRPAAIGIADQARPSPRAPYLAYAFLIPLFEVKGHVWEETEDIWLNTEYCQMWCILNFTLLVAIFYESRL